MDRRYNARTETIIYIAAKLAQDLTTEIPDYFNVDEREEILVRARRIRTGIYVQTGKPMVIPGFPKKVKSNVELYGQLRGFYDVDYILRDGRRNLPIPLNIKYTPVNTELPQPVVTIGTRYDTGLPGPLPPQPRRPSVSGNVMPGEYENGPGALPLIPPSASIPGPPSWPSGPPSPSQIIPGPPSWPPRAPISPSLPSWPPRAPSSPPDPFITPPQSPMPRDQTTENWDAPPGGWSGGKKRKSRKSKSNKSKSRKHKR